jgi:mono/diheme cytochrome c family protein
MYCASCHKSDGAGLPGIYPALKSNAMVLGNKQTLVRLVLNGKGQMPAFHFLSDKELATIISQVRQSWHNQATPVTPGEVKQARVKF